MTEQTTHFVRPDVAAFLAFLNNPDAVPLHKMGLDAARSSMIVMGQLAEQPPRDLATIRDLSCPGPAGDIPLRLYRPAQSHGAVLVYFHGGGWVIGDLDTHDALCRDLAEQSGCVVVSVDYRMGPEHRFPAAPEDCLAATRWVRDRAQALGVDASRLAVGGDSAGGNLAAVVSQMARDAGDLPIAFQLLIYPATVQRRFTHSNAVNGQGLLLTVDSMRYFHDHYIEDAEHDFDWRAAPLLREDLSGLPPALVLVAGYDPLCDEGTEYAQRLTQAGNAATLINFSRQIHGFITMGKVIEEANEAVSLCAATLRRKIGSR